MRIQTADPKVSLHIDDMNKDQLKEAYYAMYSRYEELARFKREYEPLIFALRGVICRELGDQ